MRRCPMVRLGASGCPCADTGHAGASKGISKAWLWKQAARGRKGGLIGGLRSGVVRLAGSLTERQPWDAEGISRAWWYRKRQREGAKPASTFVAKAESDTKANTDRPGLFGYLVRPIVRIIRATGPHGSSLTSWHGAMGEGGAANGRDGGSGVSFLLKAVRFYPRRYERGRTIPVSLRETACYFCDEECHSR